MPTIDEREEAEDWARHAIWDFKICKIDELKIKIKDIRIQSNTFEI
jgi:hypothetical protein